MDWSHSIRRILTAIGLLAITSIFGVIGFMLVEKYDLVDAIYMTVITMSTVGFGTVRDLSASGKIFSVVLIILSAGTFVYAITTITTFVVEGEVRQLFNIYQFNRKVAKLEAHYIICGLGRNGREAALELITQKRPFVVIEMNQEVIDEFNQHHDILVIKGDATHEETLEEANIHSALGLITSLSTDAENVYITLTARGMNSKLKIVARASNENSIAKLKRAGANQVIVPNLIGGRRMANQLTRPSLMEFVDIITGEGNPDLHLEEFCCEDHPSLINKTLAELKIRSETGVLVLGLKQGGRNIVLNPQAQRPLEPHDRLFVLGTYSQLGKFRKRYLD